MIYEGKIYGKVAAKAFHFRREGLIKEMQGMCAENAKFRSLLLEAIARLNNVSDSDEDTDERLKFCEAALAVLNSTTPDPLYLAAPELLEALKEIADDTEADFAYSIGFLDGSFPSGEYKPIDMLEWLKKAKAAIENATKPA